MCTFILVNIIWSFKLTRGKKPFLFFGWVEFPVTTFKIVKHSEKVRFVGRLARQVGLLNQLNCESYVKFQRNSSKVADCILANFAKFQFEDWNRMIRLLWGKMQNAPVNLSLLVGMVGDLFYQFAAVRSTGFFTKHFSCSIILSTL